MAFFLVGFLDGFHDDVGHITTIKRVGVSDNNPSAGSAIGLIRRDRCHVYGGVLLDHDLQQRAMTEDDESLSGSDVALSLIEHFSIDVPILIHSTNVVQVPQIHRQLEGRGFWVTRIPFYSLTEALFLDWLEEAREIWEEFGARQDRHI